MLSIELLKEVLGWGDDLVSFEFIHKEVVGREEHGFYVNEYRINAFELAFKCKEWALDNGLLLESYTSKLKKSGTVRLIYPYLENRSSKVWEADTEYKAIFRACEWILQNNKNKKCQ